MTTTIAERRAADLTARLARLCRSWADELAGHPTLPRGHDGTLPVMAVQLAVAADAGLLSPAKSAVAALNAADAACGPLHWLSLNWDYCGWVTGPAYCAAYGAALALKSALANVVYDRRRNRLRDTDPLPNGASVEESSADCAARLSAAGAA